MTKNLYLLRHAKSDWSNPRLSDHQRSLNGRGQKAAPKMAEVFIEYLIENDRRPDVILCSTAVRAVSTLQPLLEKLGDAGMQPELQMHDDLYMASSGRIMQKVQELEDDKQSCLIVAHNPGMEMFAYEVSANRDSAIYKKMREKYVTAGLAFFEGDWDSWAECGARSLTLMNYLKPREL